MLRDRKPGLVPPLLSLQIGQNVSICQNDQSVRYLCDRFALSTSTCIQGIREFIEMEANVFQKILINTASVIPVSTAKCERGFSAMNLITTSMHSSIQVCLSYNYSVGLPRISTSIVFIPLQISRICQLLTIHLVGPPLHLWNPRPYIRKWLSSGRRTADFSRCQQSEMSQKKSDSDSHIEIFQFAHNYLRSKN